MTRTYNDRRNEITASGGQTAFTYDWRLDNQADVIVTHKVNSTGVVSTLTITTDYTVAGVGVAGGGTITLVTGASVNDIIILEDNRQPERTQDYTTSGDLLADTLDGDMDRRVDIMMNHERQLDRSLHVAPIELNAVSMEVPVAVAGEAWRWDAAGTAIEHFTPVTDIGDDVTLCFGDDDDFCIAYDSAVDALEIRNAAGTPLVTIKDASNVFAQNSTFSGTLTVDGATTLTGNVTMAGTLAVNGGVITSSTAAISFGDENLSTTGTLASGNLAVTGTLSTTGLATLDSLTVNSNADGTVILGRAKIGTSGTQLMDRAYFSHFDFADVSQSAMSQSATGTTVLSCATGGLVAIAVGAAGGQINITNTLVDILSNDFKISSGTLTVGGASALNGAVTGVTTLATSGLATLESATVTNDLTVTSGDFLVSSGDIRGNGLLGMGAAPSSSNVYHFVVPQVGRFNIIKNSSAATDSVLKVTQNSTTGAVPVVELVQLDVDQEFFDFTTTIGTGNAIEAIASKSLTTTHFIKVTIPGGLTRYFPVGTIA